MKIIFWSGTKSLGTGQDGNQFLVRHKIFGPAQNILGPVKGQGIIKNIVFIQFFLLINSALFSDSIWGLLISWCKDKCIEWWTHLSILKSQNNSKKSHSGFYFSGWKNTFCHEIPWTAILDGSSIGGSSGKTVSIIHFKTS